jgi:tetratricopeptide (TPR) repeat protein
MSEQTLLQRLKERKLVQWALAYLAGAFVVFQLLDALETPLSLTTTIQRGILIVVVVGFFITLVLAWYHGEKGRQRVSGPELLMVAALLVVAGVALTWVGRPSEDSSPRPRPSEGNEPRIALLPCAVRSLSPEDSIRAEGLHDQILFRLQGISSLLTIGRTSVLRFAHDPPPVPEIAGLLDVGFVGECSIFKDPDQSRMQITFRLLDAGGVQLLARNYDRDLTLDDFYDVLKDIPQQVANEVGAFLSPAEEERLAARPTESQEAWYAYLQGEEYRLRPGYERQNLEIAQQFFERAIARDPRFALAYASLSQVHGQIYWFEYDPFPARLERTREAAEEAIRLAPDLPQARWALGSVYYRERDYHRALEELTAAAEELPGSAELRKDVGYTHRHLGNWDDALATLERTAVLDPRDADLFYDLGGNTFWVLHRHQDAIDALDQALELAPDLWVARLIKARVYLEWRGQIDSLRSVLEHGPDDYGPEGSKGLWRARLALWEREPDSLLTALGTPRAVTFEAQVAYEPGLLYAAWAHQLREEGDDAARAFASALAQLDSALQELPDDWRVHASRGLALAGVGQAEEARLEADWLTQSIAYRDAVDRPALIEARAMIFAQAGFAEAALAELGSLLPGPSWAGVHTVRLDPRYDPIRGDPRFQALLEEYADDVEH